MTNEEAIEELKKVDTLDMPVRLCEAYYMSIKALETIPKYKDAYNKGWDDGAKASYEHLKMCEEEQGGDLISRDELLKAIDTWDKFGCDADTKLVPYQDHYIPYIHYDDVIKCIKGMPPVNPQEPKTGHWINGNDKCPCCGKSKFEGLYADIWADWQPKHCPNCGARIYKPQERSE